MSETRVCDAGNYGLLDGDYCPRGCGAYICDGCFYERFEEHECGGPGAPTIAGMQRYKERQDKYRQKKSAPSMAERFAHASLQAREDALSAGDARPRGVEET